ncbi:HET-domain-containing protein [Lepidopterella palustris CBS 459.81]|uniref:HET-domain-containing protein n=1 Tax=Lepidopterella palustris CBS 459.81 TaxID=1314670 RepID=A0A8E2EFJ6_9PEZI|nr:HET-domain-containing protein [Lepidopterella palustris CBS 459.81]
MNNRNSFRYSPLDTEKRQIRLLHLIPRLPAVSGGHETIDQRSWTSEIVSLNDCPEYNSLSYTWGDPSLTRQILIDGAEIQVTESLHVALQHLQKEHEPRTLWVDALCINQSDTDEKRDQVLQMKSIYEKAKCVLVWLGPAAEGSNQVIDCLERIGRKAEDLGLTGMPRKQLIEVSKNPDDMSNRIITTKLNRLYESIDGWFYDQFPVEPYQAFVTRGWWSRFWVVQELSVAQEVVFWCGKREITYSHLEDAATTLWSYCWAALERTQYLDNLLDVDRGRAYAVAKAVQLNSAMDVMLSFRKNYKQTKSEKNPTRTLLSLLKSTVILDDKSVRLKASDERDKVYALLGLATDKDKLKVVVNYDRDYTASDVYTDAARAMLKCGDLEILAFGGNVNVTDEFPSWACDWSPSVRRPFGDSIHIDQPFHASGSSIFELSFTNQGKILSIKGIRVCQVAEVGIGISPAESADLDSNAIDWMVVDRFLSEADKLYHDESAEAKARILIGDYEIYGLDKLKDGVPLPAYRRATGSCLKGYQEMRNWLRLSREMDVIQEEAKEAGTYWSALRPSLGRKAFRSEEGYVGLGPSQLIVGDIVCIFFGADLPFVLRPLKEGKYRLVGEAYVHKVMDGELMGENPRSEVFEIC